MNIKNVKRYGMMLRLIFIGEGYSRAEYLKKKHYFKTIGEHCYLQPYNFGTEPQLISFGNNVHVASNVSFVNHDITAMMFNYMDKNNRYKIRQGEINVGNNVFIGAGTRLLYNVRIGDNVIIGAGSLVNKDIPSGSVAAGVPCRVIGKFQEYQQKALKGEY